MSLLGNIVWMIFGGLVTSFLYFLGGTLLCLTVVGAPFGFAAWRLGWANLAPFGRTIQTKANGDSPLRLVFNIVWIVLFGWAIAVAHFTHGLFLCVTIVGIPWGLQHFKLIPLALLPFGRTLS
jgi:uncharacterized membrane protein YccF (DUF307 family)